MKIKVYSLSVSVGFMSLAGLGHFQFNYFKQRKTKSIVNGSNNESQSNRNHYNFSIEVH